MLKVSLCPGLPGGRFACLRQLNGYDESLVESPESETCTRLLDQLLVEAPGTSVCPGRAWELAITDRDRLLAALYVSCFGDRIEGTVRCEQCGDRRDIDFSLTALTEHLGSERSTAKQNIEGPDEQGVFTMRDPWARFRLPTGEDQRHLALVPAADGRSELLRRCVIEGDLSHGSEAIEEAMDQVGPILSLDLPRECPECGAGQSMRFDIQSYLLAALRQEKRWLIREVHCLAMAYGWSLSEILGLTRSDRRAFVSLITADFSRKVEL